MTLKTSNTVIFTNGNLYIQSNLVNTVNQSNVTTSCRFSHDVTKIETTKLLILLRFRVRFFKKIQDWILKSERIREWILRFFTRQINPRSFGSLCIKGTEESSLEVDSSVPLMHHDPKDLGLICLVKKRKIYFRILSDFRIQSWIFLKKRTLNFMVYKSSLKLLFIQIFVPNELLVLR